jgi:YidC/Oxa1 family membrane protein insertase
VVEQIAAPVKPVGGEAKETVILAKSEKPEVLVAETLQAYSNDKLKAEVSSKGMSLKNIILTKFKGRDSEPIGFSGGDSGLFSTLIGNKIVDFQIKQEAPNVFVGVAVVDGTKLIKKMTFGDGYRVDIQTDFEASTGFVPSFEVALEDPLKKVEAGSLFAPPRESQEVMVLYKEGEKELVPSAEKDGISANLHQTTLASINGHYFSAAYLDKSDILPNFSMNHTPASQVLRGTLTYPMGSDQKSFKMSAIGFIGPKEIETLEGVDPQLLKVVKFGFFSAIAKPLLITMKWFYGILGNWGWSIILLTLLVRMIVMPFNIMSFRSMKAMQKVQPLIQSLRERYQNDPATLNREMMELMKKHKVNPMGGCLPMLLQIPIFFALYRVFSESIELYQSPFIFWIHDLSSKDAFYVLPVLMAVVMYLQQKMTPSTMDPAQAKVMQFMPLVFSFMMVSLPSALTLYMFVSTFFGILQQYVFLKEKHPAAAVR